MASQVFLVTRPNYDPATHYLYYWSECVIDEAVKKHLRILDLKGKAASRENLLSYSQKHRIALILFNAHGSFSKIFGQFNKVLLDEDSVDIDLSGAIIYARSCNSAVILGQALVDRGVKSFIGYSQEFAICQTTSKISNPIQDSIAKLFLEPSNMIPISLIKGNNVQQSHDKSINMMKKNLYHMLSSDASPEERDSAPYLWRNMKYQTIAGSSDTTI